jgi:4-amino-4-deoxy-L-arabinose transferase-like glycosyltransferase
MSRWWPLPALGAILGGQVFLLSRQLHIRVVSDEANYVLSVHAMKHGEALGRQIFISQPPGFFLWLRGLTFVLGDSLREARLAMIVTVALAAIALYVVGKELVGPIGGLAAVVLLTITAPMAIEGAQVYADTPAYALGAVAVALAVVRRPLLAGVVLTAAVSCKLSGVIAIPPVLALVATRSEHPWRALLRCAAGAAALAAVLTLVFVRDLSQIWNGVISYHVTSYKFVGFDAKARLENWTSLHAPYFWFTVLAVLVALVRARRLWPLWLWPLSAVAFLFWQKPLHDNHMLVLPYSFAGAAGPTLGTLVNGVRPRLAAGLVALGLLAAAGGYVQQFHWADQQTKDEDPRLVFAAKKLDEVTKPGDLVISDQGIVALMAHRDVPGALADSSVMRFVSGNLTVADLKRIIATKPVQAVVAARAFVIPELAPKILPYLQRSFVHVLPLPGLPGAYIYYGRRYPPTLGSGG